MSPVEPASTLPLLDSAFAAGDDRFLALWLQVDSSEVLLDFLPRWLMDKRLWARQQMELYLGLDLNFPGHEVFVKRLFRHFETARDHSMMARFMVTFDRLVRRHRTTPKVSNFETREANVRSALRAQPNRTVKNQTGRSRRVGSGTFGRTVQLPDLHNTTGNRLFRHRTRNHLRRRVWQYFRWLSYSDPSTYLSAISEAIILYRDDDVCTNDSRIDNWSLMHACSFGNEELKFSAAHANFEGLATTDSSMIDPYQPDLWKRPEAAELLILIIAFAQSSFCRSWASELLQRDHADVIRRIVECDRRQMGRSPTQSATIESWCSDLLDIHQRGRGRLKGLTAIYSAILEQSDRSTRMFPILAAAVGSASAPVRRHALALIATMREQRPSLRDNIAACLPEMEWGD